MIELLSVNPARLLRLPGGSLAEGTPADITVLAPDMPCTIDARSDSISKSKNTPFDRWDFSGGVVATIVGGRVVYRNAAATEKRPYHVTRQDDLAPAGAEDARRISRC